MKCVCRRTCQIKVKRDGKVKIITVDAGTVMDFKKCPVHFDELDVGPIDFSTAREEELLEADFDLKDLKKYILDTYKIKAGTKDKDATIALLLDSRYRA